MPLIRRNLISRQTEIMNSILIDEEDRSILNEHSWFIDKYGYADTKLPNGKHLKLHHLVIGFPPKGLVVDHKNGVKLDNRKSNLHFTSYSYNVSNRKKRKDSTQPYKGIQLLPSGKWRVKSSGGTQIGKVFQTSADAYQAYLDYKTKFYGMELYAIA